MKLTPRQRRAEHKNRNQTMVDMNLVSLIDVFTILIFFLLSNSGGVETLPSPKAVQLPESVADKAPRETVIVVVSGTEILVDGRRIASVAEVHGGRGRPDRAAQGRARAAGRPPGDPQGERGATPSALTIMGDKDIPYRLLRKIMFTGARANFADVSFAVRQRIDVMTRRGRRVSCAVSFRTPVCLDHAASDDEPRFRRITAAGAAASAR